MISFIFHLFGVAAFHFEMWSLKDIRLKIMQQKMEEELRPTVIVNGNYIVVQEGDYYGGTNNYDLPDGKARQTEEMREVEIPEVLHTESAKAELAMYVRDGLLTERYQPVAMLSRAQKAVLAHDIAERLGISDMWALFEPFWRMKNMKIDYCKATKQKSMGDFMNRLCKL